MTRHVGGAPAFARGRCIPAAGRNPSDYGFKAIERADETIQDHTGQSLAWRPGVTRRFAANEYAITVSPAPDAGRHMVHSTQRRAREESDNPVPPTRPDA